MSNPCNWCFEEKHEKQATRVKQYSERSCTDILFLIAFIAAWVGIIIMFARAVEMGGDPSRYVFQHARAICRSPLTAGRVV